MQILYLLTKDPDSTLEKIMEAQKRGHSVSITDLRTDKDYEAIVRRIFSCDKIVSW